MSSGLASRGAAAYRQSMLCMVWCVGGVRRSRRGRGRSGSRSARGPAAGWLCPWEASRTASVGQLGSPPPLQTHTQPCIWFRFCYRIASGFFSKFFGLLPPPPFLLQVTILEQHSRKKAEYDEWLGVVRQQRGLGVFGGGGSGQASAGRGYPVHCVERPHLKHTYTYSTHALRPRYPLLAPFL